tara:strand:+ start:551 stop:1387 length:837 start_codon:yes stop_codon:yes gene_type:complete
MKKDLKRLIANKKELIRLKKAEMKKADNVSCSGFAIKSETISKNADTESELYRTIVGNTYNFMDSHDDVHIPGIFTKSIKENSRNVLHLHDHVHQLDAQVGKALDIYEKEVSWSEVGLETEGKTTALLMDSRIEKKRNPNIFEDYKSGLINQHSVGMQYVKIELAVNDSEEKEEFAVWNRYKDQIINLDKAEEQGYFWAVTEAKLIEISCVIKASNELTPTLPTKSVEDLAEELKAKYSENDLLLLTKALKDNEPESPLETQEPHQDQLREFLIQKLK